MKWRTPLRSDMAYSGETLLLEKQRNEALDLLEGALPYVTLNPSMSNNIRDLLDRLRAKETVRDKVHLDLANPNNNHTTTDEIACLVRAVYTVAEEVDKLKQ